MFDDHPSTPSTNIPPNLPIGEPQDIFSGTDSEVSSIPSVPHTPATAIPSALDAGILKPKPVIEIQPVLGGENMIKEPSTSRGLMLIVVSVLVGVALVGGGWFVYNLFTKDSSSEIVPAPAILPPEVPEKEPTPVVTLPVATTSPAITETPSEEASSVGSTSSTALDQAILFGGDKDTDGDGIKDANEKELGTNPNNPDTDSDGLSDGEEFLIWHTNPQNADSDGDTYKDGSEVKSGYNPNGAGKLTFRPPTTTLSILPSPSMSTSSNNSSPTSTTTSSSAGTSTSSSFEIEL